MISFHYEHIDVSVPLQDRDVIAELGIDSGQLDAAYDAIDWDDIEDKLKGLALKLISQQGERVLGALSNDHHVWCHLTSHCGNDMSRPGHRSEAIDIAAILDDIPLGDLPEDVDGWYAEDEDGEQPLGDKVARDVLSHGLVAGTRVELDEIDEASYDSYYAARTDKEGRG